MLDLMSSFMGENMDDYVATRSISKGSRGDHACSLGLFLAPSIIHTVINTAICKIN